MEYLGQEIIAELLFEEAKSDNKYKKDEYTAISYSDDRSKSFIKWAGFAGPTEQREFPEDYNFLIFYSFGRFNKDIDKIYLKLPVKGDSSNGYKSNVEIDGVFVSGVDYALSSLENCIQNRETVIKNAVKLIKGKQHDKLKD